MSHLQKIAPSLLSAIRLQPLVQHQVVINASKNIGKELEKNGFHVRYLQDYGVLPILIAGSIEGHKLESLTSIDGFEGVRQTETFTAC